MSALTVSGEVKIPRRKGLMARALEQQPNDNQNETNNVKNFASAIISTNKPPRPISNLRVSVDDTSSAAPLDNRLESRLSLSISNQRPDSFHSNSSNTEASTGSDVMRKRRVNKQASCEVLLNPIHEQENTKEDQLSSTQHLRSGFFRSIKKQYATAAFDDLGVSGYSVDSGNSIKSTKSTSYEQNSLLSLSLDRGEEETPFMSSMAQKRLKELRKADPKKVDVTTGLQWIRLELHEMREQDKALFLQLIKLHGTIKEIRSHMKFMEENCGSSLDSMDEVASYWWPRSNGYSVLPDFSSSDGAHLLTRSRPMVKRGFSFNNQAGRYFPPTYQQ